VQDPPLRNLNIILGVMNHAPTFFASFALARRLFGGLFALIILFYIE